MTDLPYWIAFNRVPGVGSIRMRALLDFFQGNSQFVLDRPTTVGQLCIAVSEVQAVDG